VKNYCPECGNDLVLPVPMPWDSGSSFQVYDGACVQGHYSKWLSTGLSCEPRWHNLSRCPVMGCTDQKEYVVPMCTAHWGLVPSAVASRIWSIMPMGPERVTAIKRLVRDVEAGRYGVLVKEKPSVFTIDFGVI